MSSRRPRLFLDTKLIAVIAFSYLFRHFFRIHISLCYGGNSFLRKSEYPHQTFVKVLLGVPLFYSPGQRDEYYPYGDASHKEFVGQPRL